ncbi:hypothetical protein B296_00040834 [Ensete ventricosum]|uniref:Uncharacterized protein n=1 Tax=Ensete ventricosum TaxID=4639 RepID=A0A426ZFY5_ENSVE|nr:hypothetical protein B296_00040834 [Ensete ventricosum]
MSVFVPIILLDHISFKLNGGYLHLGFLRSPVKMKKNSAREIQPNGSPSSHLGNSTSWANVVDVVGLDRNEIANIDKRWGGEEDGCDCFNLASGEATGSGEQWGPASSGVQRAAGFDKEEEVEELWGGLMWVATRKGQTEVVDSSGREEKKVATAREEEGLTRGPSVAEESKARSSGRLRAGIGKGSGSVGCGSGGCARPRNDSDDQRREKEEGSGSKRVEQRPPMGEAATRRGQRDWRGGSDEAKDAVGKGEELEVVCGWQRLVELTLLQKGRRGDRGGSGSRRWGGGRWQELRPRRQQRGEWLQLMQGLRPRRQL